jgi:retron-type reverse transcriptase
MVESAYRKVKSNGGAAGVDGKDMSYMEAHRSEELYKLWNRMALGSYFNGRCELLTYQRQMGNIAG